MSEFTNGIVVIHHYLRMYLQLTYILRNDERLRQTNDYVEPIQHVHYAEIASSVLTFQPLTYLYMVQGVFPFKTNLIDYHLS